MISRQAPNWPDVLSALLFTALLASAITTYQDYGITWDERSHMQYGDYIVSVLADLVRGELPDEHPRWSRYPYGGAFDSLGAFARWILPLPEHETLHLLGAFVGILGIAGAWWLGRQLGGPTAAFWSAFLLSTIPAYFGHMFNNPKDVPFAAGYIWALAAICAVLRALPTVSRSAWIALTLACGAATCVRPVGGIVVAYLFVGLVVWSVREGLVQQSWGVLWRSLLRLTGASVGVALGAWTCLIALYPGAFLRPFREPVNSVQQLSYYRRFIPIMRFDSATITSFEVPWDYLPRYFGMKLPELHLAALLVATTITLAWISKRRSWKEWCQVERRTACLGVLLLAIFIPPLAAIVLGSALYDGLRHFLFLLPPLAVGAGLAITVLWNRVKWRRLLLVPLLALSLDIIHTMIVLHPHQYVYFNRLVGGLPGVAEAYETDYYGNSHREAFLGLAEALWAADPEAFLITDFLVDGCLSRYATEHYLRPNMRLVAPAREGLPSEAADFYLADRRLFCTAFSSDRPVIWRVERFGTTLSLFLDLRKP